MSTSSTYTLQHQHTMAVSRSDITNTYQLKISVMIPVQPDLGTHTDRTHGGTRKPVQPGVLGTPCAGTFGSLPVQPSDLGTPTSWTYGSAEKPVQPGVLGTPGAWTFGSLPVQPSDLGTPTPWTHGIVEECGSVGNFLCSLTLEPSPTGHMEGTKSPLRLRHHLQA